MLMKLAVLIIGAAVWFGIAFACSKLTPPGLGTWEDNFVDPDKSQDAAADNVGNGQKTHVAISHN